MKINLVGINAKYIHSNPAIYSLYSCLGEYREYAQLSEFTINQRSEEIRRELFVSQPNVLAFSCYIWNIHMIKELLWDLHKLLPATHFYLGGPEAGYNAAALLEEFPFIKGVFAGEGERSFKELVRFYVSEQTTDIPTIPGLILQRDLPSLQGPVLAVPMDLAEIPFWYRDSQGNMVEGFENRIIYYESSRGCPFGCSYCLSSIDKTVRFRPMDMVKEELAFFLDKKVKQVKFIDRTFNCNRARALEIWNFLREKDNGITNFHFEIAADLLGEEEIACLKSMRPGQVQLEIGVQTTNPETLREIHRTTDMEKLRRNVALLREANNIHLHLDLIAGLPYEDMESFIRSFCEVYSWGGNNLQLGFLKVLHGSLMEENAEAYGLLYEKSAPYEVLSTNWISYEDVIRLKRVEAMLELYGNSAQFTNTMKALEGEFPNPFALFDALGTFYEEKGYFVNTPARSRRYEVLLEFVKQKFPSGTKKYQELLTLDFYLREKPKSRPEFAVLRKEKQSLIWDFYKKEEEEATVTAAYRGMNARTLMNLTHVEFFETLESGESGQGMYLFFDYGKKDPLTGNAAVQEIRI